MPNHFHLLVRLTSEGSKFSLHKAKETMQCFPFAIGNILSSYTQAINKQQNRKGGLFAHRTKAKMLNDMGDKYLLSCFMYIHHNLIESCLVAKLENWEFSSYPDYIGVRNGTLVDVKQGLGMLQISREQIKYLTDKFIQDKVDDDFLN